MPGKRDLCVVFDLDDTLYQELDYRLSGLRSVAQYCEMVYGEDLLGAILDWDQSGESDIFSLVCSHLGLPTRCKESLIWVYRNHVPDIYLSKSVERVLCMVGRLNSSVVVLTDGRSSTQRLKLKSLGLSHLPAFISEEWGEEKPGRVRFDAIQEQFKANEYFYVGDNPRKDFLAPNQLGWVSIGLRGGERNVHSQDTSGLSDNYLPKFWVESLTDIFDFIKN